jgi:WD40 repeat protein
MHLAIGSIELNIDYSTLETLLANKEWHAADRETVQLMREIDKRNSQHVQEWVHTYSLQNDISDKTWQQHTIEQLLISTFPLKDWQIVDRLWVKYSAGQFGFSIQLRIWLEIGALLGEDYETYGDRLGRDLNRKFAERVGWQVQTVDDDIPQLTWNLQAPVGHLPGYTYSRCMNDFKWGGRVLGLSRFFNQLIGLAISENIADNRCIRILKASSQAIRALATGSGDRILASGGDDTTIRIWEINTGNLLLTLAGHSQPVVAVAIDKSDRVLVSGSHDKTIRIFDLQTQQVLQIISCDSEISAITLTLQGDACVSSHHDGTIRVWKLPTGELLTTMQENLGTPNELVTQLAVLPNGQMISKTIQLQEYLRRTTLSLNSLEGGVAKPLSVGNSSSIALSNDGRFMLTPRNFDAVDSLDMAERLNTAYDRTFNPLVLVEVQTERRICNLQRSGSSTYANTSSSYSLYANATIVTKTAPNVYLASGRWIRVWDASAGELQSILGGHTATVSAIAMSSDEKTIISASEDGEIRFWQAS